MAASQETKTLHILLATMPLSQSSQYIKSVRKSYYTDYRQAIYKHYKDSPQQDEYLYSPAVYYMLGNYDIAFISVIDSFKFAQNLFIPDNIEAAGNEQFFHTHAFQSISGVCLGYSSPGKSSNLGSEFKKWVLGADGFGKVFFSAINIKLNNGLLLGNGMSLLLDVVGLLKDIIKQIDPTGQKLDYFILQSFSWYELNLTIFYDDIDLMKDLMGKLRCLTTDQLDRSIYLRKNSLYRPAADGKPNESVFPHVIIDTQSYTGIRYEYFKNIEQKAVKEKLSQIKFKTEIEWQLLPGYLNTLADFLNADKRNGVQSNEQDVKLFNTSQRYMLTGKSDYFFCENDHTLYDKILLYKKMTAKDSPIKSFVKKVKTRILLADVEETPSLNPYDEFSYFELLKNKSIQERDILLVMSYLKSLKISRPLSNKIKKIIASYNGGIEDQVLFPYYLDFHIFINQLVEEISLHASRLEKFLSQPQLAWQEILNSRGVKDMEDVFREFRVQHLEMKLLAYVEAFEKAHHLRALTSYQFEDITDIDLDFNMSIQQLLSAYTTILIEIGKPFYPGYTYGPLVQLSDSNNMANSINVYYNVYHLISPEFIFSAICFDVLSYYKFLKTDNKELVDKIEECGKAFARLIRTDAYLAKYVDNNLIDFNYHYLDAVRLIFTFNCDFDLFQFWFWTYNFQNSSLYSKMGMFEEAHFKKELFRLLLLSKIFGDPSVIAQYSCPIPELQTYWSRYYDDISQSLDNVFHNDEEDVFGRFRRLVISLLHQPIKEMVESGEIIEDWNKLLLKKGQKLDEANHSVDSLFHFYSSAFFTGDGESMAFIELIQKRDTCFFLFAESRTQDLKNGNYIPYDQKFGNPVLFLSALMYAYLKLLYEENGGNVCLLRRNWKTGQPDLSFVGSHKSDHLYCVDQLGGVFFDSSVKQAEYFRMRNGMLQTIWHFAYIFKLNYISQTKK